MHIVQRENVTSNGALVVNNLQINGVYCAEGKHTVNYV